MPINAQYSKKFILRNTNLSICVINIFLAKGKKYCSSSEQKTHAMEVNNGIIES